MMENYDSEEYKSEDNFNIKAYKNNKWIKIKFYKKKKDWLDKYLDGDWELEKYVGNIYPNIANKEVSFCRNTIEGWLRCDFDKFYYVD